MKQLRKRTVVFFLFFFQAEDGIRDLTVTGVQTCALPIFRGGLGGHFRYLPHWGHGLAPRRWNSSWARASCSAGGAADGRPVPPTLRQRSEERRVGKECRSRWSPDH